MLYAKWSELLVEEKMNSEIFGNHVISIKIEITW
jgi:hypothetical protein